MASIASSSRVTLGKTASSTASQSAIFRRRHFASSSRVQDRQLSITFANHTTTFQVPSLSSLLDNLLPASVSHQPALAGFPLELTEMRNEETQDVLEWDGVLNAVPKSKVSHSRKAMRSANKGLKDRVDFVHCASCGQPKLAHHICASCFSVINRVHKAYKKNALKDEMKAARDSKSIANDSESFVVDGDSLIITSKPKLEGSNST